jgi:Ankyrin repeats (3 copies)/Ankyrin repeat
MDRLEKVTHSSDEDSSSSSSSSKQIVCIDGRVYSRLSDEEDSYDSDDVKERIAKTPNPLSIASSQRNDGKITLTQRWVKELSEISFENSRLDRKTFDKLMRGELTMGEISNLPRCHMTPAYHIPMETLPDTWEEGKFLDLLKTASKETTVLKFLKKYSKNLNCEAVNKNDGNTFLHLACVRGFHEVAKWLIDREVPLNVINHIGQTALHVACVTDIKTALLLISFEEVDVNIKDKQGRTPLHKACSNEHKDVIQVIEELLKRPDVDIDAIDNNGRTPLSLAYSFCCPSIVEFLINEGARSDIVDNGGGLPADWAKETTPFQGLSFIDLLFKPFLKKE